MCQREILSVFRHCIYEHEKGVRPLFLITVDESQYDTVITKLQSKEISFYVQKVSSTNINIYFGDSCCIKVVRCFVCKGLANLSDEEDFMLGIMLGYSPSIQCKRYISRKQRRKRCSKVNMLETSRQSIKSEVWGSKAYCC